MERITSESASELVELTDADLVRVSGGADAANLSNIVIAPIIVVVPVIIVFNNNNGPNNNLLASSYHGHHGHHGHV